MVEPILKALRVFDKRTPTTIQAWLEMNSLKKHMFNLQDHFQPTHIHGYTLGGPIHEEVGYDAHQSSLCRRIVESVFYERHGDSK
jgi:hypothetical protein